MSLDRKESFPCLICGRVLYRGNDDYEAQPDDGVMCSTHGNYGSTAFDPLNGEFIAFNICDECLKEKGDEGRLMISQSSIPVWVDTFGICGWYPVERPYVAWRAELEPSDERYLVEFSEIIEGTYSDKISWNDRGEHHWPESLLAGYLRQHPEEIEEWKGVFPEHVNRINEMLDRFDHYQEVGRSK